MRVDELMCRNVEVVSVNGSLADAARVMWDRDCGCVPVVDADRRVVGMITDRDICMATCIQGQPPQALPIEETMSPQLRSCQPDQDVREAEKLMQTAQVRRLPVVDRAGRVVGILSLNDIARATSPSRRDGVSRDEVASTLSAICQPWRDGRVGASA